MFTAFFGMLPILMIVAQITIVGMLALSESAAASAMMFPLLVITILFTIYINQQHFKNTQFLPSKEAIAIDMKRSGDDFNFLRGEYKQPSLREKEKMPENITVDREIAQGVEYATPENSVVGDDEAPASYVK